MSGYRNAITQELLDLVIWGFATSPIQIRRFRVCLGRVLDYAERISDDIEIGAMMEAKENVSSLDCDMRLLAREKHVCIDVPTPQQVFAGDAVSKLPEPTSFLRSRRRCWCLSEPRPTNACTLNSWHTAGMHPRRIREPLHAGGKQSSRTPWNLI